jgi:uncharacterized SAM-binding protein YcdF (DUF218 family)
VIGGRGRLVRGALAAAVVVGIALAALAPHAGTALVVRSPVASPDVIVSLASHEWERLPAAVAQAQASPDALVVLTVPKEVTPYNCHDCAHRPERLIAAGVEMARIRQIPLTAGGTYGEALAMKAFMGEHVLHRLLVVTSPYHTRRSLATFNTVFAGTPVTIGVVPASRTSPARPEAWWWSAYDRAYVRYEWAAIAYYQLRYDVPF